MEVRIVTVSDRGTGQDAVISPLLANIYLLLRARADSATRTLDVFRHHVINLWHARCGVAAKRIGSPGPG